MSDFELTLLGETRTLESVELAAEVSPHTNRPLAHIQVYFTVSGEKINEAVVDALTQARNGEHALTSPDGRRWLVVQNNWSRPSAHERYEHQVELREAETLIPSALELAGVALSPERYSETIVDGRIRISVIVAPDAETDLALERLIREYSDQDEDDFMELRRVGVSENPISVMLSQSIFEQTSTGRRHLLTFFQECEGQEESPGLFWRLNQPELTRTLEAAAAGTRAVLALVSELEVAGVLTAGAGTRVREALRTDNLDFADRRPFTEVRTRLDDYFVD